MPRPALAPDREALEAARAEAFRHFRETLAQQGRSLSWVARQLTQMVGHPVEVSALWNYVNGKRRMPEELEGPLRYVLGVPPLTFTAPNLTREQFLQPRPRPKAPKPTKATRLRRTARRRRTAGKARDGPDASTSVSRSHPTRPRRKGAAHDSDTTHDHEHSQQPHTPRSAHTDHTDRTD